MIAWLIAQGLSLRIAKLIVYIGLPILAFLLLWGAKALYDRSVVDRHEQKVEQRARPATDKAADERASDTIKNAETEKGMHDAIAAQPDQPIAPTSRALSCERLRKLGRNPPACR